MSTQSGCDPRAAVEVTLRHLLVDLPSVTTSPMTGEISIEVVATETHYEDNVLVIDKAEPITTWRVVPAIDHNPVDDDVIRAALDGDSFPLEERMRELEDTLTVIAQEFDPSASVGFEVQRDPGDETAA